MKSTIVHSSLIPFVSLLFFILISCNQPEMSAHQQEILAFQNELNEQFADAEHSPLVPEDLETFESLKFFSIEKKYCVEAKFVRAKEEIPFGMKTSTDRLPVYIKYGEAHFKLNKKDCLLSIYQNTDLVKNEEYKDYLFLPFTDLTSGEESYGGGRYIDLKIPIDKTIIIDFNKSYNPYCAYNHKYSCPIPPMENRLDIEVRAGVKAFH